MVIPTAASSNKLPPSLTTAVGSGQLVCKQLGTLLNYFSDAIPRLYRMSFWVSLGTRLARGRVARCPVDCPCASQSPSTTRHAGQRWPVKLLFYTPTLAASPNEPPNARHDAPAPAGQLTHNRTQSTAECRAGWELCVSTCGGALWRRRRLCRLLRTELN